jgi:hypothetical protein
MRDLMVTMDDATNATYSAFLVEEEGTASTFRGLAETFGQHGLPLSLYTDRGSHYFHTPQARGRSERMFQTLQDRLVKELALAGMATMEAANVFLREVYIPAHNHRFAIPAEQPGTAFTPISGVDLAEILCVQEERQVGNDNCVSFNRLKLQIPESPLRAHFVKASVKVRQYPDGTHAIFHGPRCLGRYNKKGAIEEQRKVA